MVNNAALSTYLKQVLIASKIFSAVPTLHTGMSTNRVAVFPIAGSKSLARMTNTFSPPWSLLSSVIRENLPRLHSLSMPASRRGASAFFTIIVVFMRPDANLLAMSLSGNNPFANFVKWSATEKERLCSATNWANLTSAVVTFVDNSVAFELTKNDLICGCVASEMAVCCLPWAAEPAWCTASLHPPEATLIWEEQTRQNANVDPLSLGPIQGISATHSGLNFAAYFFLFAADIFAALRSTNHALCTGYPRSGKNNNQ